MDTMTTLKTSLADSPKSAPPGPADLVGWRSGPESVYVCSECAGRIMARNCNLPSPAIPVWADGEAGTCQIHGIAK